MTARRASVLAWVLCLASAGLIAGAFVLEHLGGSSLVGWGAVGLAVVVTFPLVGAVLASRRPESPIGWIFCAVGLCFGLAALATAWADYALLVDPGALPLGPFMSWVSLWAWNPGILLLFTFLLLLFPNGRLPSRRWRPVAWLSALALALMVVPIAITGWPVRGPLLTNIGESAPAEAPFSFKVGYDLQVAGVLLMFVLGLAAAASLVVRFRRARGDEREQIKWFAFAGAILVITLILASPLFHIGEGLQVLALPLIPLASAVAILKYRLYDIDVVIRKTVVYGILVVLIMALALGALLALSSPLTDAMPDDVETGAIALAMFAVGVLVWPLRRFAVRIADRVVFGGRATPYEVLTQFAQRVGETYSAEDVLPRMAQVLGRAAGAHVARVWLRFGEELRPEACWPADGPPVTALSITGDHLPDLSPAHAQEVRHQGELLGALSVAFPPSDPMNPSKDRLVRDLAAQAGPVLRNVRLIDELRASRRRIVAAQDERAKQLERNIHDGAQQQLVALAVKQRLAEGLIERDPDKARRMMAEIRDETTEALENLRDLARGIYPPLLADKGLKTALDAQVRKAPVPVELVSDSLGRYAPEIEAAVYFCCLEALQNIAKYANATHATVRLSDEGDGLAFEISDDGSGFDPRSTGYGTGLRGMADRLEAVDGTLEVRSAPGEGTVVTGRLLFGPGGGRTT